MNIGVGMKMEILAILMVAFGLFAVLMFVLFYAYAKKFYNERHYTEDYDDGIDDIDVISIMIDNKEQDFEANNYVLKKDDQVKVLINFIIYDGVVTEGNHREDSDNFEKDLPKLVLVKEAVKEKNNKKEKNINKKTEEDDYIPKKKK